ncbi:MAG: hypothetical protein SFV19_16405 [Rhodospirillaceae bacterium]|nr:hypothetical protein [Rhodospirillaceae bacterium]
MSETFRKSLLIALSAILAALIVAVHGYGMQRGLTMSPTQIHYASLSHA